MRRNLHCRLERLEQRYQRTEAKPPLLVILSTVTAQQRQQLAPGERIVLDLLRNGGLLAEAVERITCDPNDQGSLCAGSTYSV